jgi:hypothetical protein
MELNVGDKFKAERAGTVFIIDAIVEDPIHGTLISSSMEDGKKGYYRDSKEDFIQFLKDMFATKIK